MRLLYLLALFQLVAGPLVLFQVSILCKHTLRDIPRHGIATAAVKAWQSPEFQAAIANPEGTWKSPLPSHDPKGKPVKLEMPSIAWQAPPLVLADLSNRTARVDTARTWTPAWPQAPPAPPPRAA